MEWKLIYFIFSQEQESSKKKLRDFQEVRIEVESRLYYLLLYVKLTS